MTALNRAVSMVLNGAVAGLVIAIVDMYVIVARSYMSTDAVPSSALIVAALNIAFATVVATTVFAGARALSRAQPIATVLDRLSQPGEQRVRMLLAIALTVGGGVVLWAGGVMLTIRAFASVHSKNAAAIVAVTATLALAGLLAFGTAWVAPLLMRRARAAWAQRFTRGRIAGAAVFVAGVCILLGVVRAIAHKLPAWEPTVGYQFILAAAAVVAIGVIDPAGRVTARLRVVVGAIVSSALVAGLLVLPAQPAAREAISRVGFSSRIALRAMTKMADGDGDGIPRWPDGADCNDSARDVSPLVADVPGNDVDENCSGADASVAMQQARLQTRPAATGRAFDVLVLTVDALRADHVASYGYRRPTTPRIDELANESVVFARATSPSPITRRAMPSLLFGRYATTLPLVDVDRDPVLQPNKLPSLGTELAAAGYRNHAIMAVSGILGENWLVGFQSSEVVSSEIEPINNGVDVASALIRWLRSPSEQPRLTWAHFTDAHNHYIRPPGAPDFGNRDIDRYDSEIAHVDREVGRVLDALRDTGALDRTIVIITADHGEAFGERGLYFHGASLYDNQIRVPLIVRVPGFAPRRVNGAVSLVDIMPTLLELVGRPRPVGLNGRSLVPALKGEEEPAWPVLSQLIRDRRVSRNIVALITGTQKLVWNIDSNSFEAYDLAADPLERHDVFGSANTAALVAQLRAALDAELSELP